MQDEPRVLAGRCFCGAVEYRVPDAFRYCAICHCPDCRRRTGSAFKPFAGIEAAKVVIAKGQENLAVFGDAAGNDTSCKLCGSLLYSVVREGQYVHVAMGT